ncbi:MAG TPA: hypothetical protein DHW61_07530 [Lachnoclostridium phytofermentans]|uniref:Uncharacterized protein n=2 Tax=Lachnoclostridium TaxID=1506553 RepID=A0A3D2X535_9FIRM|nr:hypothetical protein [Lachnoclostridium phytofermentans]
MLIKMKKLFMTKDVRGARFYLVWHYLLFFYSTTNSIGRKGKQLVLDREEIVLITLCLSAEELLFSYEEKKDYGVIS